MDDWKGRREPRRKKSSKEGFWIKVCLHFLVIVIVVVIIVLVVAAAVVVACGGGDGDKQQTKGHVQHAKHSWTEMKTNIPVT